MLYNKEGFVSRRRARDIIKKLKQAGFKEISQRGSHLKLKKGKLVVIVPIHGGKDLGIGLIKAIEKQSNVKLLGEKSDKV